MERWFNLFVQTGKAWLADNAARLGAALAFYSVLSLAPLLVIVIAIAALVFGKDAARGAIVHQFTEFVGPEGAAAIQDMIVHAQQPVLGSVASLVGIVTLFLGAAGVFGELQEALNTIWKVKPKSDVGLWGYVQNRFLSFAMVFGTGFMLLISLVLSAGLNSLSQYFAGDEWTPLWWVLNFFISFGVVTLLFAMIYKYVPDAEIRWNDVWVGAILTALLFTIGKTLIGLYLGSAGVGSAYGAAGSLVVLLVWIYYSAQILFFGAEFTHIYAQNYGEKILPAENA
ncbi:MAG: YihY/virulence factor BrkB family protein [Pirellulales bacterium]|nr:YihY/virulence factor BrkB family protein [Pirellulales bacterium]